MLRLIIALVAGLSALFLILTCGDSPTDPFSPENAKISLLLKSSTFQESDTAVTDTVGKTVRLGLCLYLTRHIDSTVITVSPSSTRNDTILKCTKKDHLIDTAFYDLVFASAGTRTVSAIAYVGKDLRQVTAKIHIIAQPTPNRNPELTVTGPRSIHAGQACTLLVSVNDPDSGQVITIDTLKCPKGSCFSDTVFTWLPTIADTGIDTIIFIARDNGSPVLTDTAIVPITVKLLKVNHPPHWSSDTVDLGGIVGVHISLTLADRCSDTDNDTLSFALLSGAPDGDTVLNDSYSITPASAHEGTFYPRVIARDPQPLSDTLVIKLTINPADTTPPTLHRISPSEDTTTISASSCQIRVSASDESGILSMRCAMGPDSFTVTRSADTVYSATVTGLAQDRFNRITFIAIDSSRSANRCTLSVYIKYDPTMLDAEGPVIIQKIGPTSGSVITNPEIAITDSIIDPSGIDSVYWTLNGVRAGTMSAISGSSTNYTLRDTLTAYRVNRMVIHAIDGSTRGNRDSAVVELDYNLPPNINDTAVTTDRNAAKTWSLSAQSQDNDTLFWSRLSSPSSLSGTITGALPSITFTPVNNWSGTDSFFVRVTDSYWSDTAKIIISIGALLRYNLTISAVNGIVTAQPTGPDYDFGTVVQLTAIPSAGYRFVSWSGNLTDTSSHVQITMNANKTVTAHFIAQCTLKLLADPPEGGSVTGAGTFDSGTVHSINCSVASGYQFTGWTISSGAATWASGSIASTPSSNILLNGNATLTANVIKLVAPDIIRQPQASQVARIGDTIILSVSAIGTPAPTFQWYKDGNALSGKTDSILIIRNIQRGDSGVYNVAVRNAAQSISSRDALVDVRYSKKVFAGQANFFFTNDGALWVWGLNWSGQIGDGTVKDVYQPKQHMSDVSSLSIGPYNTLFFKKDGTLWGCGGNTYGQLGDTLSTNYLTPKKVCNDAVILFSSGLNKTIFYSIYKAVWICGQNEYGELGLGTIENSKTFVQIPGLSDILNICSGDNHSTYFLKNDHTLWACGYNYYGQLGDSSYLDRQSLKQIMSNVSDVAAGQWHTLILGNNGIVYGCGYNGFGQLSSLPIQTNVPLQIPNLTNVIKTSASGMTSLFLKSDSTLWGCGNNLYGELGDGTPTAIEPEIIKISDKVIDFSVGSSKSLFIKSDGTLWGCGKLLIGDSSNYTQDITTPKRIF